MERILLPLGPRPHLTDIQRAVRLPTGDGQAVCGVGVGVALLSRSFLKICVHQWCSLNFNSTSHSLFRDLVAWQRGC